MPDVLTGRELDRAVALKLGWEMSHGAGTYMKPPGAERSTRGWDFSESLDTCFGPSGITEWLEAHGMKPFLHVAKDGGWEFSICGPIKSGVQPWHHAQHELAATALCHAFLSSLEETG